MPASLKGRALVLASLGLMAAAGLSFADRDPGRPVSDALCAELRGGNCPGVAAAKCDKQDVCSNNGYVVSGDGDGKPDGAATTYCTKTYNGQTVCNDSMQSFLLSCGE